jgi:hypothetical protein
MSTGISLYTLANAQQFPPLKLFTKAANFSHSSILLSTAGYAYPNKTGSISLFLANTLASGSTGSGLYRGKSLYLEGGKIHTSMPLYLGTTPINYNPSGWMPLYIAGPITTGTIGRNLSLFVCNNYSVISSRGKKLFTAGTGGLAGGLSIASAMPLVIGRGSGQTAITPLYVGGKTSISSGVSLSISGSHYSSNYIPMYVGGTGFQHSTTLYIGGPSTTGNSFSLYTKGLPSVNSQIGLFSHGF